MSATTMVRERIAPQQVATWSGIVAIPITISWYASTFAALRTYLPSWTSSTLLGAAVFLILLFLIANVFHLRSSRSASSDGDGITRILIVNPHDGERVVHEAVVRGSVTPENTQLQVLVQSGFPNDVWWYPQLPEPWTRGHEWEKQGCHFGSPTSGQTMHRRNLLRRTSHAKDQRAAIRSDGLERSSRLPVLSAFG